MKCGNTTAMSPLSIPSDSKGRDAHVALLRGINVGGKNKLPMRELAAIFAGAGCTDVRTYVQSGNVVFRSDAASGLGQRISAEIRGQFGIEVPVILRSGAEMRQVMAANPFLKGGVAEDQLHVYFLADAPTRAALARLDPDRSPGDTFVVAGREVYLHLPDGVARTKLTNVYFDRVLGTVSTMRNWRTCGMLAGMV